MQYTFRFRRRSYIASNDCSIFSSYATYYSYLKKTLYAGNVRVLGICILARYLSGLWLVAFLGTVYILLLVKSMRVVLTALIDFAISKIYESRFNGSHRQRSYQLTFASNPPCSAFPNSTFMPCNLAIRWTIDSPSPLPVAVCPGGR